jgi:dTDP-4-amino-4,6-dideoxygalactose transaminase
MNLNHGAVSPDAATPRHPVSGDRDEQPAILGGRPVREQLLLWGRPVIGDEEIAEVVDTLRSGWIGPGPKVRLLEDRFKDFVGVDHAIAVNSCTAGLGLALEVLGVGPGDEVITTPMTFAATANVIAHRGAVPVFADIDRDTLLIDLEQVARRITPRTKAIIPVHLAGRPCDMSGLAELARAHDLAVVADCAHAIEARHRGRLVSAQADISVHSFSATKNMTTGEGGMVLTDNDEWAQQIKVLRNHGLSHDAWERHQSPRFQRYETVAAGYKHNMTDIQASLGLQQMQRLDDRLRARERHWQAYRDGLAGLTQVRLPTENLEPGSHHARHLFVILLDLDSLSLSRDEFVAALLAENIGAGVHYAALHMDRFYRDTYGFRAGDLPAAEWVGERTLSLPLSAALSDDDAQDVIHAVRKVTRAFS